MKRRKSTGLKGLTREERYAKSEKRFLKIQALVDKGAHTVKEACYELGANGPFYYQWKKKLGNVKFTTTSAPVAVKRRKKVTTPLKTGLFVGTASDLIEIWESL